MIASRTISWALLTAGCVTISPVAERVSVYSWKVEDLSSPSQVPQSCRLVAAQPPTTMTELDMEAPKQPYRPQREEAAARGANALLVRARQIRPRGDFECAAASPITDCPGSFGAWFSVVFESYTCAPDALEELAGQEPQR